MEIIVLKRSSIVYGGTSALFQLMAKIRAQNHEHNFMSAKIQILYSGNFLETICWEILGNYLLGNLGGCQWFFEGGNYGTMLWHHNTVSRQWYQGLN